MAFQIQVTMYRIGSFNLSPAQTRTIPVEGATIEYAVDDVVPYIKSLIRFPLPGVAGVIETAYVAESVASIVNQSGAGSGGGSLVETATDDSASTISLDFGNGQESIFVGSPNIGAVRTVQMVNAAKALRFSFTFNVTGLYAITLPSNFLLNDARWNNSTKVWTPLNTGNYKMSGWYDGTSWWVDITGGTYQ